MTNKKPAHRRGKVQLIDGTAHFQKMKKSLGDKRNELSEEHIAELVRLYGDCRHNDASAVTVDGVAQTRICSKIFENREFGFLKVTVERPLRLNFQASPERVAQLWEQSAFAGLATSKKRKDEQAILFEVEAGQGLQASVIQALRRLDPERRYLSRDLFVKDLDRVLKQGGLKVSVPVKKAILAALSEADPAAEGFQGLYSLFSNLE